MTKNDIKELPNFIDASDIIKLTDFLDKYGVNYKVLENNNTIHEGRTSSMDADALGERIDRP